MNAHKLEDPNSIELRPALPLDRTSWYAPWTDRRRSVAALMAEHATLTICTKQTDKDKFLDSGRFDVQAAADLPDERESVVSIGDVKRGAAPLWFFRFRRDSLLV